MRLRDSLRCHVDNGFEAYYVVDADKKKKVAELKRALAGADELFLATDEDREGEETQTPNPASFGDATAFRVRFGLSKIPNF